MTETDFSLAGQVRAKTFNFNKSVLVLLIIFIFSSLGIAAPPTMAPLNPEFTAWRTAIETGELVVEEEAGIGLLGYAPSPVDRSHLTAQRNILLESSAEGAIEGLPSSYDSRTYGYITSVKDQGGCGSCWSFASYGSFESWLKKNFFETWDFSENHLKNYHGFDFSPCEGGNADMSTAYLARWSGPVDESDDPYHDSDDRPSPGGAYKKCLEKVLWFFTDDDIKNAIMSYSGVYVSMYWTGASYNSSQYTYYYNGDESSNHAVTLVGWDDNKVIPGAPGNGAWLIKNSWGSDWGDNGYFWISYYDTKAVTYAAAFCGASTPAAYSTNYQYDPLGWTTSLGYETSIGWAANIFVPTSSEKLKAIGLYAVDDNISYMIRIYDNFNSSTGQFSGILMSFSGTLANAGYHTIFLPSQPNLTTGNNFAVVVRFTTTGYGYPIPVELDISGYSSGAAASSGQSYVSAAGTTFTDLTSISGFSKANVCIRAITESATARTLSMSSTTGGSTIPPTGTYLYSDGETVDVYAFPDTEERYHFVNWTGSAVTAGKVANPSSPNTAVLMDNSYSVIANFAKDQNSLTVSAGVGGTVAAPGIGTYSYDYGSNVNISASEYENYTFLNWTGSAVTAGKVANPDSASTVVLMDANYTVHANFKPNLKYLKITATPDGGTVTDPGIGSFGYLFDTDVNVTAQASGDYRFVNWTGTAVTAGKVADPNLATTTVNMSGDYALRANFARTLAFPGAEGAGRFATGGRGGDVYEVTNLNNSGPGSIVDALSQPNRTIVFRVSGTIELDGVRLYPKSYTTIAGQTAPGDGICIKGRIILKDDVHDIIIRYIRVRVDEGAANSSGDAIDLDVCSNVIIDHVTASYSRDEGISCQEESSNITVQWCIISEALTYEDHSYGSLIRGQDGQEKTYHHNLYAHNNDRNPRPGNYVKVTDEPNDPEGLNFDFRNNVIYNWSGNTAGSNYDSGSDLAVSRYNFIGNVYIPGPESTMAYGNKGFRETSKVSYGYFTDNSYDGSVPADAWSIVYFSGMTSGEIDAYKERSYPIPLEPVTTTSPAQAKAEVLLKAGASFPKRDIIDERIVKDAINKTGYSIETTDEQPEGGWPTLNSLPAPTDSDHDGMPDEWEIAKGLNPNDAEDRNDYYLSSQYTNLEVYLNSLLREQAPYAQWAQRYGGTAGSSDYATDMALDLAGNAYVTGYAKDAGKNYGFATVKYAPNGNIIWTKTYNRRSTSYDYAMAINVDKDSNIIVAGYNYTTTSGYDGAVIKYNSAGEQLWVVSYNSSGTADDRFYDVVSDANGDIYAAGRSNGDAILVKYTSGGVYSWEEPYNGSGSGFDAFYQVSVAADSNVYACGETQGADTGRDGLIVKYAPDGNSLWTQTYNRTAAGDDWFEAIALDAAGNAYVTGTSGSDYATMKYTPDGDSVWTSFYNGTASGGDESYAIVRDSGGNIVVTGHSENSSGNADAATVKYNSSTGAQIWAKRYNGAGNWTDYAEAIAADGIGNVYIHGRSFEMGSMDYLTICYDSSGNEIWKRNYDGALMSDMGSAIAVYDSENIFVTGSSMSSANNYDYATVKYVMTNCPLQPDGDLDGDCCVDFKDFLILADDYVGSQQNRFTLGDIADSWLECWLVNQDECWQ
jgi:C1A family cysteine protease